jgi:hypothetical protein
MSDDKPNPIEDVRKGLGLLFRAAKTAVEKIPTKDVEQAVVSTAREVGRAVENVASTIERQVRGAKKDAPKPDASDEARADDDGMKTRVDAPKDEPPST